MSIKLVVVRAFGAYARGDVIEGEAEIGRILNSEHATYVVRVLAKTKES